MRRAGKPCSFQELEIGDIFYFISSVGSPHIRSITYIKTGFDIVTFEYDLRRWWCINDFRPDCLFTGRIHFPTIIKERARYAESR
jgi:hypothetical protein